MKMLLALVALTPMLAFAEGGEQWPSYYPAQQGGRFACKEGQTEMFIEYGGQVDKRVWRTCHNGAFVETSAPRVAGCQEGRTELFIETDATSGNNLYVTKTCHNGIFR